MKLTKKNESLSQTPANALKSTKSAGLKGEFSVPGDKSISHRVAILGGLAEGTTAVRNFLCSSDCLHTLDAMRQLGATITPKAEMPPYGLVDFDIHGVNMHCKMPTKDIDCGNSGTGMRLLAGILAAQPFVCTMTGDESLCSRPMNRIITPLQQMGAHIIPQGEKKGCAPLKVQGGEVHGIHYVLPMASAQVKSAILLAGLFAHEPTTVSQPAITRDHTERLFEHFSIPCDVKGLDISIQGNATPKGKDILIPGDISSAAFWLVAASIVPSSCLHLKNIGVNPTRSAIVTVLQRMGADIKLSNIREATGEPVADISINYNGKLKGTEILAEEIPNLIDEIPILAVAGAFAQGDTIIRHAAELRVKESDRISTTLQNLRAMGGSATEHEDGMTIHGGNALTGCELQSFGDHRIAMSFLVAGLASSGITVLSPVDCIDTSYPGFGQQLASLMRPTHA